MGIIYCYTNKINGKKYVGQTINPEQRKAAHKYGALNKKSKEYNSVLHKAFRKYGLENFIYEILATSDDKENLNMLEIYFINKLQCQIPYGYNVLNGGTKAITHTWSKEQKEVARWAKAALTKNEVIELRKAYKNQLSPSKIYNEKYKNKISYQAFLNIWCGKRYSNIMSNVFLKKNDILN